MKTLLPVLAILAVVSSPPAGAAPSEKRLALVIGNASYKAKPLATAVNDAALIAQTLQAAGFDVMGARDLDEDALRRTFRDFIDSVTKAGPDATAAVYFAGYGLQLEGENYLVPTEADIVEASDVPLRAVQLSELTQALAALHLKTTFMILDVARASPFVLSGQPPAGGLAWVEPETNMLIAFNAAPGTVSPDGADGYGPYAKALAEMIREGGLTPVNLFDRVRLRVNELTKGAQVPWDASKIETQFMFLERGPGAPPRADSPEHTAWMRSQPMRSLGAHDAYMVALARDTFDAYADFLADYWHDPMTNRVRALLAARREAITWRRTCQSNAPDAYLSYLERYPRGPHVADARRLLAREGATIAPPSRFEMLQYEVPPPLPDELEHIERTVLVLDDPAFAFEPPPPSPVYFLEPPPPELLALVPPAAPFGAYILPAPKFVPLPSYVGVPVDVVAPPHPPGVAGDASNLAARLPPSVAPKAALIDSRSPPPPTVNPVASEEIKAPLSPPLPTVPSAPLRPTDNEMTASRDIEPPAPTTNDEPPISVPATLAPPPTGMSRRAATPSRRATGGIPLPVPRPVTVTLEPPLTGTPLPTPGAVMPSPEATGSIPLPTPRPVAFAPPPTRNRQKPIAHTLSTSSPREVNPTEQRTVPLLNWLTYLGRPPKVTPEVSPPKPRGKPCAVVNGRLVCG